LLMMHLLPNQFGYLTTTLRGERGEYDQSGTVGMFAVPSEHLTIALQLRPEGPWSPGYVTPDGTGQTTRYSSSLLMLMGPPRRCRSRNGSWGHTGL
jgi:hypothetical protein